MIALKDRSILGGSIFFGSMLEHRSLTMSVLIRPIFRSFNCKVEGFGKEWKEGYWEEGKNQEGKGH